MITKPNLLVLGASGGVANAFLHFLPQWRHLFRKLVLLDKNPKVLSNPYLNHELLKYTFLHKKIVLPRGEIAYRQLLSRNKIHIVLDLTDMNSTGIIEATNRAKVAYVNTAMNDVKKTVADLIFDIYPRKEHLNGAPHILCAGMNPGVVNMWVRHGVEEFGVPEQLVHFEYDTSIVAQRWQPAITWSVHEFLVESVRDPAGVALGRRRAQEILPNALENTEPMKGILEPIMKLDSYPDGFTVLHEENLSLAWKYDIPSKFYAIDQQTSRFLRSVYRKTKNVKLGMLMPADNNMRILDGADNIGVALEYPDKRVYYFNSAPNEAAIGTNGTYTQVIVGVFGALATLLFDNLASGVYFVEDLFDTHCKQVIFDNMRVRQFVFRKAQGGLQLIHYEPFVRPRRPQNRRRLYVM